MKSYSGLTTAAITGAPAGRQVWIHEEGDNRTLDPAPSLKLANRSPDGFNWGYGGSGPAQLALAILLDFTGSPELALEHYEDFKWQIVAVMSTPWLIDGKVIAQWLFQRGVQDIVAK